MDVKRVIMRNAILIIKSLNIILLTQNSIIFFIFIILILNAVLKFFEAFQNRPQNNEAALQPSIFF
jgi:hypothetical protein